MSALVAHRRDRVLPVLVIGTAALMLREVGAFSFLVPLAVAAGVFAAQPPPRTARPVGVASWLLVTAIGVSAFVIVRLAAPGVPSYSTMFAIAASVVAAGAEEIVFRRGLYGVLERWGPVVAIGVSAVVFALVHVPMYGWTIVPLDAAAGVVFGWQSWATGTWTAPAVAHGVANVLGSI